MFVGQRFSSRASSLQFRSLLQVYFGQGSPWRRRSYPAEGTPDPLSCRRLAVEAARGSEEMDSWGEGGGESGRESRTSGAECAPGSNRLAPAHPSWRPEPRQRSRSPTAPRRARASSLRSGRETPLGFIWATRAKRWREGGGRSGAWTPTRAEPSGEAERAWEPWAGVAGPPPATAECPRCLPAGPLRKALSPRQSLCRRLPARRPYNPPSLQPAPQPSEKAAVQPGSLRRRRPGQQPGRQPWEPGIPHAVLRLGLG